jgi:predicted ATPase/DNA-binding SARP family transcriptional activator
MNTPSVPLWTITLFGSLAAVPQGQGQNKTITRFRTQKFGALLGFLACHVHTVHSRESLFTLLWPEMTEKAGRNNLSVALSSLRNQLEPPGTPGGTVLLADRFHVGLNPASVTTDVAHFEEALEQAGATSSTIERGQCLSRAIDLYRGPLLRGYDEEWIAGERERLGGLFFGALGQRIDNLEADGDLSSALSLARKAAAADPLREEGQTHLIRLLAAMGQPHQALRQFRDFERLLEDQAGDEPSEPLWSLIRQIEGEAGLGSAPSRADRTDRTDRTRSAAALVPSIPSDTVTEPGSDSRVDRVTLTFLLMEIIEDSTARRARGNPVRSTLTALETYRRLVREAAARHGSADVTEAGESLTATFTNAGAALSCAIAAQQALQSPGRLTGTDPLRVRMALHTADVEGTPGTQGTPGTLRERVLHRVSRMLTAAHAGQVLLSETAASLVRENLNEDSRENARAVYLIDLGMHRLHDVPGPEHLFQVNYPHMDPAEFPPLAAQPGCEPNMPTTVTRFFGRGREIAEMTQLLRDPRIPLVTITGPGGTGKTRLALEAAGQMAGYFGGAVFFVPLAGIGDPALIPGAVLEALRLPPSPQREPLDQAVEALAKQPALLVLDNLEHLLAGDAAGSIDGARKMVEALLSRVATLTLLVTSRQVLGLPIGREFALSPLPTPSRTEGTEGRTPEELSRFDSVALFLDRAQSPKPDFQITDHNALAISDLCDRLDGIPLAIELAAARALVLTPAQMLAQLDHRFEFLRSSRRGVDDRLRTLGGAIDWSYNLLSPDLQRFFARLSVFRGGWTAEAAEAVCKEPAGDAAVSAFAVDCLAQLCQCSLVLAEATQSGTRFRMLETLREYAEEQLLAGERLPERAQIKMADVRRRHQAFYLGLAEQAEAELSGDRQTFWMERLETEHENLRAALQWALEDQPEQALRLAGALSRFWEMHGHFTEGRVWLREALKKDVPPASIARAKVLCGAGKFAFLQGDFAAAQTLLEEGLVCGRAAGASTSIALALLHLGLVASYQDNFSLANTLLEESLEVQRALGNKSGVAQALLQMAMVASCQLDFPLSNARYEESLSLLRELGDQSNLALALYYYAENIVAFRRDYLSAAPLYDESLAISQAINQSSTTAYVLWAQGNMACDQSDFASARRLYRQSCTMLGQLGHEWGLIYLVEAHGYLAIAQHEKELQPANQAVRAAHLFGAAEALRESRSAPLLPPYQARHQNYIQAVQGALKEDVFAVEWSHGRTLELEHAVTYALEEREEREQR